MCIDNCVVKVTKIVCMLTLVSVAQVNTWYLDGDVTDDNPESNTGRTSLENVELEKESFQNPFFQNRPHEFDRGPGMHEMHPVLHAGLPRNLTAYPVPKPGPDHELMLNVSWLQPADTPARDFSIEVRSTTNTAECRASMCYDYNIPGDVEWWLIPTITHPVAETCAVRPGCAYHIRLIGHPWDGHTAANLQIQLDECVSGVCSCAHAPRLPAPEVSAFTVPVGGELFANISWTLPPPRSPYRLPKGLNKQRYFVSLGKQMVSDAHPAPWFSHTTTREMSAEGPVSGGDSSVRWMLLPVVERGVERRDGRGGRRADERERGTPPIPRPLMLDIKMLARVSLVDDRGCMGPAGNATAYDPATDRKLEFQSYVFWAVLSGTCVIIIFAMLAITCTPVIKRVLNALRPAPPTAPLKPLSHRPAWFALRPRT